MTRVVKEILEGRGRKKYFFSLSTLYGTGTGTVQIILWVIVNFAKTIKKDHSHTLKNLPHLLTYSAYTKAGFVVCAWPFLDCFG